MSGLNIISDFVDYDGERIQPYYAAFMIEHGFCTARHCWKAHGGSGYIAWNSRKWSEFLCLKKLPKDAPTRHLAAKFEDWLAIRAVSNFFGLMDASFDNSLDN